MKAMMSPKQFVEEFSGALQDYLEYQYRDQGHLLDLIAASGEFFSVSYHSVSSAMNILDYTETTAQEDVKLEQETPNETTEQ